jgi:hypothetical protein
MGSPGEVERQDFFLESTVKSLCNGCKVSTGIKCPAGMLLNRIRTKPLLSSEAPKAATPILTLREYIFRRLTLLKGGTEDSAARLNASCYLFSFYIFIYGQLLA